MESFGNLDKLLAPHLRDHAPYVPGEQTNEAGVLKLNTNENPYPPSPKVYQALKESINTDLRKYPDPLAMDLRSALAKRTGYPHESIVIGNGSDELLLLAARAFGHPGRPIVVFEPSYSLYPVLAKSLGLSCVSLELTPDWDIPDEKFPKGCLAYLPYPNAQTGTCFRPESLSRFINTFPGVVILDEAYADFADSKQRIQVHNEERVIVVRTFSKSYSLAGIRIGYALCGGRLAEGLLRVKDAYNVDRLAQAAALAALEDQAYFEATINKIRSERTRLARALEEMGLPTLPSQANYVMMDLASPDRAKSVSLSLRKKKILVRHFPDVPRIAGGLRITVGTPQEMDRFLSALREII